MATPGIEQSTILIIDDDVAAIRLLADMVKDLGKVKIATTGQQGLKLAREFHPHLVLLDVDMPELDGFAVCERLKGDPATADVAVIFVTGASDTDSEIKALQGGAADFISKPLNRYVVRARVQTHLKLQRQAAALIRAANRDGLTGIFNRRYFDEQVQQEFLRHRRQGLSMGLALIDIDHFKLYNDRYGHLAGDDCLARVAMALDSATLRPGEFVARYGGEEFVAVLPYVTVEDIGKYGARLCEFVRALHIPHEDSPTGPIVTISVGLTARTLKDTDNPRDLLHEADQALYQAKSAGRDRFVVWSSTGSIR